MRMITAAISTVVLAVASATACAAADMPRPSAFGPGPEELRFSHARLVCNEFGDCFRVGPYGGYRGPEPFYGPRRLYAPRRFSAGPIYDGGRPDDWRETDRRGPEYRRYEEHTESFTESSEPVEPYHRLHRSRHVDEYVEGRGSDGYGERY